MRGPKPPLVELSRQGRQGLETLVHRHSTPQQLARRGRIVLQAAAGLNNCQIARQLDLDVNTVGLWRQRWIGLQGASLDDLNVEDRLSDAPRPGAPVRITPEQVCQMVALACEAPSQSGRPISQWTSREVADEIVNRGIEDRISPRHAARLLERGT